MVSLRLLLCVIVMLLHKSLAREFVDNASFERRGLHGASGWNKVHDYHLDPLVSKSGNHSIRVTSISTLTVQGAYQIMTLDQKEPSPVKISGWSKSLLAGGVGEENYAISVDFQYTDGTWERHIAASFPSGTHDFVYAERVFLPTQPIKDAWVYCLFGKHFGTVWFDGVSIASVPHQTRDEPDSEVSADAVDPIDPVDADTEEPEEDSHDSEIVESFPPAGSMDVGSFADDEDEGDATDASDMSSQDKDFETEHAADEFKTGHADRFSAKRSAQGTQLTVAMRYLVLSNTADDMKLSVVKTTLNSVGMQFDVVLFGKSAMAGKQLSLSTSATAGKYAGIIATDNVVAFDTAHVNQLRDYQRSFGVKYVVMYSYPTLDLGVAVAGVGPSAKSGVLRFGPSASAFTTGYPSSASFAATGTYCYPSEIADSNIASPAITISYGSSQEYVAAAFVTLPDSRRQLHFFIDHATWAFHSVALGPFWLQWLTNGLYLGSRRILLNMHVDDLFMESATWDPVKNMENEDKGHRITPDDLSFIANWQDAVLERLPAGSEVISTMAFNGETVVQDKGGYNADPLYLRAKTLIPKFHFESHTYSHPYLDQMSYKQVTQELNKNYATAKNFFGNNMDHPSWSNDSMVTPSITGLFSVNALKAMWEFGIRNVVGDNTRAELLPAFEYHGLYTTKERNGFPGIYVVPRFATEIYYFASTEADEVNAYNFRYRSYYGKDLTLAEIMTVEMNRAVNYLLAYRHDPYMFHQSNLAKFWFAGKTTSLMTLWADYILDELTKYSTLPVKSQGHDALADVWHARETRDACGFNAVLNVASDTRQINSINVSSTKSCKYGITGLSVSNEARVTMESYGPDTTAWLQMDAGSAFSITPSVAIYL